MIDTEELKIALATPGVIESAIAAIPELAAVVAAGRIAQQRTTARELLAYARARAAAKAATYADEYARLDREHLQPVRAAQQQAEAAARQVIAQLTAAEADLSQDKSASLPTREQVDAAILGFGE